MELKDIMDSVIRRVIIPCCVLHRLALRVAQRPPEDRPILSSFEGSNLVIIALQLAFIALEYAAAGIVTKRRNRSSFSKTCCRLPDRLRHAVVGGDASRPRSSA